MRRTAFVWLIALPLSVVGSQLAHELAYRLVVPDGEARGHELAETGHFYLAYLPLALAVCTALVGFALANELRAAVRRPGRSGHGPSARSFALLAPVIFICQEHFERLGHDGSVPWNATFERTVVVGLALQLPFALAAYVLARVLLRAARTLGHALAARSRLVWARALVELAPCVVLLPRPPVLALGYPSRGPPAPLR